MVQGKFSRSLIKKWGTQLQQAKASSCRASAHVGLWLVKNALQGIAVKLTTRFEEFTWSGQACELNDIHSFVFVVCIACHPLKDPSLWIPIVAANVEGGIEL